VSFGVIIQARLASTRLPRKVLADIGGRTMLERVVDVAQMVTRYGTKGPVIVAVPQDELSHFHSPKRFVVGSYWFGGPPTDVLRRYTQAAARYNLSRIMRLTADCPLLDVDACLRVRDALDPDRGIHYASNVHPDTDGLDCEVFTRYALTLADEHAEPGPDREHVTPYMRRHLRCAFVAEPPLPRKTSVDTAEDLAYVRELVEARATMQALS
jgi:spore coat polysaccharide biosynthesis protein SpsF (cytidylyltransferase family)